MPSAYIAQSELVQYGVDNATVAQITSASSLVDAYLRRPSGLMYMNDFQGLPCYMAALSPSLSLPLPAPISPGVNVVIQLPGPAAGNGIISQTGTIGTVLILDRASGNQGQTSKCEACVISAVAGNTITLANVQQSHAAGVAMEWGLTIQEQRTLPSTRSICRLGNWPLARLLSGLGSYRYGRRNDQNAGLYDDRNLLSIMQTFGGPPAWQPWDILAADFNPITGEVWIPTGIYMAYYSDVRIYYIAGFTQANIPPVIKQATAGIIIAKLNTSGLEGGVKMAKAGDTALERFANTVLDEDMRAEINQYVARAYV